MYWKECPNVFLFKDSHNCFAKVWRRPLNSNQDWELVETLPCSTDPLMSCSLQPHEPESHEFAVSYVAGGLSGAKVQATEYHRNTDMCKSV